MSNNQFDILLKQKRYKNKILKNAKLNKVVVDPKVSLWVFHIELDDFIDADLLYSFAKTIKELFNIPVVSNIDIVFKHKNKNNFSKYASNYWDSTLHYLIQIKPNFQALENYSVEYKDNSYNLKIDKDSTWVGDYFPEIQEVFKDLDIDAKIEYIIDKELTSLNDKINEGIDARTEILNERSSYAPKKEIVQTQKMQYNKASYVKINEIPIDQYGLDKYRNEQGNTRFTIAGEIIQSEVKELRTVNLLEMIVADDNDAIIVKSFLNNKRTINFAKSLKKGMFVELTGNAEFDTYVREVTIMTRKVSVVEGMKKEIRKDKAKEKRVELHLHTKMSEMDGVTDVSEYIERAELWGHKAIAFTDHNSLTAYPEISKAMKGKKIKPIFGAELDVVNPEKFVCISDNYKDVSLYEDTYVVFDIETTGLSAANDKIIEIGAVKVKQGQVLDRFQSFVNPEVKLSEFTTNLTSITNDDVKDAKLISEVMPEFLKFIEGTTLVAHNAAFDMGFMWEKSRILGYEVNNPYVDTLSIARYYFNDKLKRFNLKALSRFFKVDLDHHHRADQDAEATSEVWIKMIYELRERNIKLASELYNDVKAEEAYKHMMPQHMTVLAKNQAGYKGLFEVISKALTDNFYKGARTLRTTLEKYRDNLLIGSACDFGDVFDAALNGSNSDLIEAIAFYDFIEVQPPSSYLHLMEKMDGDGKAIIEGTITKIIKTAKSLNKTVVATGNAHYLDQEDSVYRDIFIRTPVVGGGIHPLKRYGVTPKQHFKTTNEMLEEFGFLDLELAKEIVIKNTNKIANKIEHVKPFSDELFSLPDDAFKDNLKVPSIEAETKRIVYENAHKLYGENLHPIVEARIEKELKSIIGNKFAPIYYMSYLLVKKSLEDGYLVGSRGSVGSSFVATLMEITEVNPLRPHYRCKNGDFLVFPLNKDELYTQGISEHQKEYQKYFEGVQSGFDLPDAKCPVCGETLVKDGHDIPFETFLGFKGDKVPDIDLNFSGDYQATAHEYVRELLGEDYTFKAGTIQTVAERTAYGFVLGYLEDNKLNARRAQINRLASNIQGVKRSTGQHPGGIIVVPKNKTIFDVTPIQYPANDVNSPWYTTHFDYHSFEDNFLKLDILGHDDPTMIKFLMDYVHENPDNFPFDNAKDIPLADAKVFKMFNQTKIIGVKNDDIMSEVASFGIPEFGTPFTREMLNDTKPDSFAGLVKISGLSHGTGVWRKNAQDLISKQTQFEQISFNDIIACRDDIMVQLSQMGLEPLKAFDIMEFVRKGKPSKQPDKWKEYVLEMEKHNVPEWYIWSATQIQYMFPKAHAIAYVIMAIRIAWFKLYHPTLFYSAFFSKRASQFDYEAMVNGANAIRNKLKELEEIPIFKRKSKDNNLIVTLGVSLEMVMRGFKFLPVHIEKSEASVFVVEDDGIRMPFVSVDGLGGKAAIGIVEAREEKPFDSIKDVFDRAPINKTVRTLLEEYDAFSGLKKENNVTAPSLFENFI